jgi:hypothetical protein
MLADIMLINKLGSRKLFILILYKLDKSHVAHQPLLIVNYRRTSTTFFGQFLDCISTLTHAEIRKNFEVAEITERQQHKTNHMKHLLNAHLLSECRC